MQRARAAGRADFDREWMAALMDERWLCDDRTLPFDDWTLKVSGFGPPA